METSLMNGSSCEDLDNATLIFNCSFQQNVTEVPEVNSTWSSIALMCLTSIFLALIILATIIGNVLVIVAVFIERNLQNVANRLIVSLAVADLMVACFVMGPAAHYMISGSWHFGAIGCDLWTSADVLCCSASILHLLAVALDRYWAVSRINWTVNRNKTHINLMILMVWLVAFMVSVAPLLGWKDPHFWDRIEEHRCIVSPDVGYQVFATVATFYAPTMLILILYWKIWQTAKSRIRHRPGKANNHKLPSSGGGGSGPTTSIPAKLPMSSTFSADELSCHTATVETSTESVVGSPNVVDVQEMEQIQPSAISCDEESGINPSVGPSDNQLALPGSHLHGSRASLSSPEKESASPPRSSGGATQEGPDVTSNRKIKDLQKRKESLEAKRERKAAKTLAVITGAFMACWLPFFVQVLVMALCQDDCPLPEYVANAFQWLGYINSTLNPCIYTVFNPEFRQAFKRILFGGTKASRRRH